MVGWDKWGHKLNYYSDAINKFGLLLSIIAKLTMNGNNSIYVKNVDVLTKAVRDHDGITNERRNEQGERRLSVVGSRDKCGP